jgi:hypothetical protein
MLRPQYVRAVTRASRIWDAAVQLWRRDDPTRSTPFRYTDWAPGAVERTRGVPNDAACAAILGAFAAKSLAPRALARVPTLEAFAPCRSDLQEPCVYRDRAGAVLGSGDLVRATNGQQFVVLEFVEVRDSEGLRYVLERSGAGAQHWQDVSNPRRPPQCRRFRVCGEMLSDVVLVRRDVL